MPPTASLGLGKRVVNKWNRWCPKGGYARLAATVGAIGAAALRPTASNYGVQKASTLDMTEREVA